MKDIPLTEKLLEALGWALDEGMDPAEAHTALAMATAFLFKRYEPDVFNDPAGEETMVKTNAEILGAVIATVRGDGPLDEMLRKRRDESAT